MKIIVDTNLLIDFSRKAVIKKEEILWPNLVRFAKKEGHQLILPVIALFEFFCGDEMEDQLNVANAENILSDLVLLDLTEEVAKTAALLFRLYKLNIGVVDYILAATSIVEDAELATLNPKHFKPFNKLRFFDFSKLRGRGVNISLQQSI